MKKTQFFYYLNQEENDNGQYNYYFIRENDRVFYCI